MGRINPAAYDAWYETSFGAYCHRLERDALFSLAVFRPGEKLLDAGCGTGVYLQELIGKGPALFGLDGDADMLRYARGKNNLVSVPLAQGRLEEIPFKDRAFDKVLSVCALEFAGDAETAVMEMARVLKDEGVLLLGFLNGQSPWARTREAKAHDPASIWHSARFYSLADIASMAGRHGLALNSSTGAVHLSPDSKGMDVIELERAETSGRSARQEPAFISAVFVKS